MRSKEQMLGKRNKRKVEGSKGQKNKIILIPGTWDFHGN